MSSKYSITVKSNVSFYTAIFERVYVLEILNEKAENSVVNLKSYDKVPSGYVEGGSDQILAQNLKVVFKDDNINKNIANLAIKLDISLQSITGCQYLNSSRKNIVNELNKLIKEKEQLITV